MARATAPSKSFPMAKLLAIALVVVTVLPILIFATDLTNRRPLQALRERSLQRAGVRLASESENAREARRERNRVRRANIHPAASTVAMSMASYLVVLIVIAVVGRRVFALRL